MPELNNINQLRMWLRQCPALSVENRFRINYLGGGSTEYALYSSPSAIRYTENVLGEEVPEDIQELNFVFASKESYGSDVEQNLLSLAFYDDVCAWIIEQNSLRNFPQIEGGRVKSIVPTLSAFPAEVGSSVAKYQIQLKMTYKIGG